MVRFGRIGAALVAAVLLASCATSTASSGGSAAPTTSAGAPPQAVTGRALGADGRPLAGHVIALREDRGIASDVFGTFVAALSLGTSCLAGLDPCRASGAVATTAGDDGSFRFEPDAVAQARGRSKGVVLRFGDPTTEGGVAVAFDPVLGGDLGAVSLWDPQLTATPTSRSGVVLRWRGPDGADGRTVLRAGIADGMPGVDGTAAASLVTAAPQGSSAVVAVDRRALEDRPAVVVLSAGFRRPRAGQRPRVDWSGPPRRVDGAGPPLSRGAACGIEGLAVAGCPLTDGDLATPVGGPGGVRGVTVDLGRALPAGVIAVRGVSDAVVDVSGDGVTFVATSAARPEGTWPAALATAGGAAVRFVRVRPASTGGPFTPAEISVWSPEPFAAAATAPPETTAGGAAIPSAPRAGAGPTTKRGHRAAVLLAVVLLLVVLALAAGAMSRRRRLP